MFKVYLNEIYKELFIKRLLVKVNLAVEISINKSKCYSGYWD